MFFYKFKEHIFSNAYNMFIFQRFDSLLSLKKLHSINFLYIFENTCSLNSKKKKRHENYNNDSIYFFEFKEPQSLFYCKIQIFKPFHFHKFTYLLNKLK